MAICSSSESHNELRSPCSALELMLECHSALQEERGRVFGAEFVKCALLPEGPSTKLESLRKSQKRKRLKLNVVAMLLLEKEELNEMDMGHSRRVEG